MLPGLIDVHTHLVGALQSANVAEPLLTSAAEDVLLGAAHARATLAAGFTAVRDVGVWRAFADVALREAIAAGHVAGPRMAVAGAYLTAPGGGGEITGIARDVGIPADMRFGVVHDASEMRQRARDLIAGGADFLKLIATGAVLTVGTEPGQPELTEDEMRAAVEVAARHDSYVTAHAHGAEGIRMAVRAGVRSIEHGSLADEAALLTMRDAGVWLVADIYNTDHIDAAGRREGWPEETLRKNIETGETQRAVFRRAVELGVRIAFGTDAGVFPHGENARQFAVMVRHGMSPLAAIRSATLEAAELMRREADIGAIEPGRFADLIAIEGDPLADIARLEHVAAVLQGGRQVRR